MLRKRIEKKDKNTNVSLKPQGSFCLSGFHYCSFGHTQTHQESSSHLSLSSLSVSLSPSHVFFIFVLFAGTIISKTIHEFHISFAFFNLFYSFCHYQIVLSVLKFTFFPFLFWVQTCLQIPEKANTDPWNMNMLLVQCYQDSRNFKHKRKNMIEGFVC